MSSKLFYKTEAEVMKRWKSDCAQPTVSVCCITYNHKDYIAQAIDSFLMQETDFPFEILIHDDASTDGATEIIRSYENKYPHIIKTVIQDENQYSKDVRFIFPNFLLPIAKGKYIALCEGDDYWTSNTKLSKQLHFMDKNLSYSCCFHAVNQKDDTLNKKLSLTRLPLSGDTFYFKDVLKSYFIPTLSLFFRKELMPINIPSYKKKMFGDVFMQLILTSNGPAYYFNEVMGVYRHHDAGVSKGINFLSAIENNTYVLNEINELTKGKYEKLINKRKSSFVDYCYFRQHLTEVDFFKACYYLFKLILLHPFEVLSRLKKMKLF